MKLERERTQWVVRALKHNEKHLGCSVDIGSFKAATGRKLDVTHSAVFAVSALVHEDVKMVCTPCLC